MTKLYPQAYIRFLAHFHGDRDYFECHEILEEYWKEHPESPYREAWVALIQAAVGMYHYRRGNTAGAIKSLEGSIRRSHSGQLKQLGVDAGQWVELLRTALADIRKGAAYRDVNMPIVDEALLQTANAHCDRLGCKWGSPSRMEETGLIHRHKLRDRTEVIEARRRAAEVRQNGSGG